MTFNFLDKETGEKLRDSAVRSYEFYEGYVEKAYNYTNTINKSTNLEGYTYMGAEGEVAGSFTFENANKTINLYFEKNKPVEEPIVEEPVIEEPVVEEPAVTEPEIIADEEVPEAAPVIEEVEEIEETIRPRHKSEKAEPIAETSTDETTVEEVEEIAEELEEEEIADEEAPLASFEVAEAETTEIAEVLVKSPLTGDNRNTGAWAGLSLASLLGILYLSRKRKVTE
ncbi:MAG: LPXTG cell wall anchor domain-containing protein, partial [Firmicutes bacterium]|nr:LPXTG cell wall anchor domain-containing protein [Bacillota bacterium]